MILTDMEINLALARLRENCDIREPERRNGYLTALLELQNALTSDPSLQPADLKNLPGYFEFVYELNLRGIRSEYVRDNVRRFIAAALEEKRKSEGCQVLRELKDIAATTAVPWAWLEEYAKEHPAYYPTDFIFEAKEVFQRERITKQG